LLVPDLYTALGWIGRRIYDVHGARIGRIDDIFVDRGTPRWLAVNSRRLRRRAVAVSADDVLEEPEGRLHVPYERTLLTDRPAGIERAGLVRGGQPPP
jgi:sporulation protein YlmC with PRC-barrel domain